MHGQHALGGQSVVEDAERTLLDLARVLGATDEDLLAAQVDQDDRLGPHAVPVGVGTEGRGVHDREIGCEALQVLLRGRSEQVAAEDARPRCLGVGADPATPPRVGSHVAVTDVHGPGREMVHDALPECVVALLADGPVEASPPDALVRITRIHGVLVVRRAAGVGTGPDGERTAMRQDTLMVADRVFHELADGEVGPPLATELAERGSEHGWCGGHRTASRHHSRPTRVGGTGRAWDTVTRCRSRLPQSDGFGRWSLRSRTARPTRHDPSIRCRECVATRAISVSLRSVMGAADVREVLQQVELGDDARRTAVADGDERRSPARQDLEGVVE